ncbi:hypothetical protein, partial [Escherichia coli]|uniref:hypothetical protein n=1 Tax=Escherichia coli TaxID=562 RepID=UPI00197A82E4
ALYVEHKTSKINIPKIKTLKIQYHRKMMMTNENAKTSLFPRRSRPVADHPTGRTRKKRRLSPPLLSCSTRFQ